MTSLVCYCCPTKNDWESLQGCRISTVILWHNTLFLIPTSLPVTFLQQTFWSARQLLQSNKCEVKIQSKKKKKKNSESILPQFPRQQVEKGNSRSCRRCPFQACALWLGWNLALCSLGGTKAFGLVPPGWNSPQESLRELLWMSLSALSCPEVTS